MIMIGTHFAMLTLKVQVNQLEKTIDYGGPSEICGAIDCVSSALENLRILVTPPEVSPEPRFDEVWPGEEEIETRWKAQGGIDFDGMCWSTPRMIRISDNIVKRWEAEHKK